MTTKAGKTDPPVRRSRDAGAYYCAHTLFALHHRPPSTVLKAEDGQPLAGFLHVPPDPSTTGERNAPPPNDRFADLRPVVAWALAGLEAMARPQLGAGEHWSVLLTGFGAFRDVTDNPTGAFVQNLDEVARAVAQAFGNAARGDDRVSSDSVVVVPRLLPVDDRLLNAKAANSLEALCEEYGPHSVLSLGVSRSPTFDIETQPNDAGLSRTDGTWRHEANRPAREILSETLVLAEAIERGRALVRARTTGTA